MFLIRYRDRDETEDVEASPWQVLNLSPAPNDAEYPEHRAVTKINTSAGRVLIQRPRRDGRPRYLRWFGYPANHPVMTPLSAVLSTLEYRHRLSAGLSSTVAIWEDSTDGGFDRMDGNERVFTEIRITQVNRTARPGITDLEIEFYINDDDWTNF